MSQKKEDFIASVENALHFFNGVPAAIVPDNLKSAVTKSHRYEPRDKSLAEGAVKILYQRIYPVINRQVFHSLRDMNKAIWKELETHNNAKLTGRPTTRYQLYIEDEKAHLKPLPVEQYKIKKQAMATVMLNSHVLLGEDKYYYSVPYQYIRKHVKLLYTSSSVEVYYKYNRIATHKRELRPYNYTTNSEHLATTHRFITDWTPQRFINGAASIDEPVKEFIVQLLEHKQHPEQAYRSCMGVLSMAKK